MPCGCSSVQDTCAAPMQNIYAFRRRIQRRSFSHSLLRPFNPVHRLRDFVQPRTITLVGSCCYFGRLSGFKGCTQCAAHAAMTVKDLFSVPRRQETAEFVQPGVQTKGWSMVMDHGTLIDWEPDGSQCCSASETPEDGYALPVDPQPSRCWATAALIPSVRAILSFPLAVFPLPTPYRQSVHAHKK